MDEDLMNRIYAYNRRILEQEKKAEKEDEIRALLKPLQERPGLSDLLSFLRKIREVLTDD